MPPPPSQKGKFRPKKPPKKKSASTSNTAAAPDFATSSNELPVLEFAPLTSSAGRAGAADGSGRGGRGRGRGRGRDGRGGGRGPRKAPTGKAFFTAGDKPPGTGKKKRSLDKFASKKGEEQEEIVDILDVSVGARGKKKPEKKTSILESMDQMDQYGDQGGSGGWGNNDDGEKGASSFIVDGAMYDSDSSREEQRGQRLKSNTIQPVQLPFPMPELPVGVGQSERPVGYEPPISSGKQKKAESNNSSMELEDTDEEDDDDVKVGIEPVPVAALSLASPFVDVHRKQDLIWEQNNWFLVQLPTRLPKLKQNMTETQSSQMGDDEDELMEEHEDGNDDRTDEIVGGAQSITLAETAVKPVFDSFDNILSQTAPGRIGKMKVYKSGKTVLVLDSQDGQKEVSLNVHEGLTCGFLQQAVAIDIDKSTYVGLGDVTKSVVISPDLGC